MAIEKYIQDLLYRYECVILPGFGAFIAQQQSVRFSEATHQFFPPSKRVSFNRQLVKNDGLLASYIAEVEKRSYKAALERLEHFIHDLQVLLNENGNVRLDNIGTLIHGDGGRIEFEPAIQVNYLKEAFGLEGLTATEVDREIGRLPVSKRNSSQHESQRPANTWVRYAAVGLLAVGLSGAAGFNYYSNQVREYNLAQQKEAASLLENQIQQATFLISNPLPAVTLKVSKQSGAYHIVAGAFRESENAEKKVRELRKEGFPSRQIKVNKYGLHQVVYSSHEDRREALNALWEIKRNRNPKAWLLVKEQK